MKTKLMALMLATAGTMLAETHVSIGVRIGGPVYAPVAPPVAIAYRPPCPGPGYVWIDGYRDGYGQWFNGYWAMPPYAGAYWIGPRLVGRHFYPGYWGGARRFDRDDYRFRGDRDRGFREGWRDRGRHDREDRGRGRGNGRGWGRDRH